MGKCFFQAVGYRKNADEADLHQVPVPNYGLWIDYHHGSIRLVVGITCRQAGEE